MADDAARIEQLEAELRRVRAAHAAEVAALREQQTATAEVLRLIASSPADLDRVLHAVAQGTMRRCDTQDVMIFQVVEGGARVIWNAGPMGQATLPTHVMPINRDSIPGRAMAERATLHIPDVLADVDDEFPGGAAMVRHHGIRTALVAPLMRQATAVGALYIRRTELRPFTDEQITLLETFADQAVIAIENARLFAELQEKSRALEAASQHKSQFLANMSHELRTPLNAIIGYSEMLQEEAEEIGEQAFIPDLQKVNAAGKHLLGLINDILDLSKIEAGRMDLFLETLEVGQLVMDVAAIVQPLVEKNGNALVVQAGDNLRAMHADQTKVRQTLFNLLSNAAKFTSDGTIELRVKRESG